jgi:formylmethanofuran dehydrogenase subunit B
MTLKGSSKSHTGEFLSETIEEIIDEIGPANFSVIVTDSRIRRKYSTEKYKIFFNVRCMVHAINLISKVICFTSSANRILTKFNTTVTF